MKFPLSRLFEGPLGTRAAPMDQEGAAGDPSELRPPAQRVHIRCRDTLLAGGDRRRKGQGPACDRWATRETHARRPDSCNGRSDSLSGLRKRGLGSRESACGADAWGKEGRLDGAAPLRRLHPILTHPAQPSPAQPSSAQPSPTPIHPTPPHPTPPKRLTGWQAIRRGSVGEPVDTRYSDSVAAVIGRGALASMGEPRTLCRGPGAPPLKPRVGRCYASAPLSLEEVLCPRRKWFCAASARTSSFAIRLPGTSLQRTSPPLSPIPMQKVLCR